MATSETELQLLEDFHRRVADKNSAGLDRLSAVIFKLKMVQKNGDTPAAVDKFEKMIEGKERQSDRETLYGFLIIGGLIIFLTVVVFLVIRMFVN